jgi:DNA-binding CsgD family transcriptional regulator
LVRAAEWRRIHEFAVGVPARDVPALLAISGEAGAGKSTLWRAGIAAAADAGCRVLRSEPSAAEAEAAFAGLSDLLSGVLPDVTAGIPEPQREALEVALLLRPAGERPPAAHAVGLAVLSVLRSCLDPGPVLVAIDDVQWLDAGSREALTFALRRIAAGPLGVLLAARTDAPADPLTVGTPPLPHGWRDLRTALPETESIDLAPLDYWQIQSLLPPAITAVQARLVAEQSRGNPFWALEISANLDSGDAGATLPQRALTLSSRLTQLAADALAMVAAAGRITVSDATAVLGRLVTDPAAALDAAVLAGVITEAEGRVSVAHPLIGAAAVESLPPGRRQRIYRLLAEAATSPEGHAYFAALAAGPGPDPRVADALDAAAEAAHARAANAAASQFAAQAVTFTPESDAAAIVRRHIRAGELLDRAGDLEGSVEQLEALDIASLGTADLERALPLLTDNVDTLRGAPSATATIVRELDGVGPDPRRRGLLLALASDAFYGIPGQRRAAAVEAIACAGAAGPEAAPTLHRALLNLMIAKVSGGEGLDASLLEHAEHLEGDLPALALYDTAARHRGLWSRFVEDLDTSRAALQRLIVLARDAGEDVPLLIFLSNLAETQALAGDFAAAGAAVAEARHAAALYDWPARPPWHTKARCELLIAAGSLDEALRLADELHPGGGTQPTAARFVGAIVRGKISTWRGDPAAAIGHFEQVAWCADQWDWSDPGVRERSDSWMAEAYVSVGRPEDARRIAARLAEIGARLNRPALTGDAARIDAVAAAAIGDLDTAAASARAALEAHERSPLRVDLARTLLVLARIERRRRARGRARDALQRARALADEMGHRPLQDEIGRELPRVATARSEDELTAAEQRVAGQIAAGATSQEAAAALFISVRTVETHVASIYRKLGVRTRSELRRTLSAR